MNKDPDWTPRCLHTPDDERTSRVINRRPKEIIDKNFGNRSSSFSPLSHAHHKALAATARHRSIRRWMRAMSALLVRELESFAHTKSKATLWAIIHGTELLTKTTPSPQTDNVSKNDRSACKQDSTQAEGFFLFNMQCREATTICTRSRCLNHKYPAGWQATSEFSRVIIVESGEKQAGIKGHKTVQNTTTSLFQETARAKTHRLYEEKACKHSVESIFPQYRNETELSNLENSRTYTLTKNHHFQT